MAPWDKHGKNALALKGLSNTKRKVPVFKNNTPGPDFINNFLNRNKHRPRLRTVSNYSRKRAFFTAKSLGEYFDNLEESIRGIPMENIYNYDETNLSDNPGKTKCLVRRGCKYPIWVNHETRYRLHQLFSIKIRLIWCHYFRRLVLFPCATRSEEEKWNEGVNGWKPIVAFVAKSHQGLPQERHQVHLPPFQLDRLLAATGCCGGRGNGEKSSMTTKMAAVRKDRFPQLLKLLWNNVARKTVLKIFGAVLKNVSQENEFLTENSCWKQSRTAWLVKFYLMHCKRRDLGENWGRFNVRNWMSSRVKLLWMKMTRMRTKKNRLKKKTPQANKKIPQVKKKAPQAKKKKPQAKKRYLWQRGWRMILFLSKMRYQIMERKE